MFAITERRGRWGKAVSIAAPGRRSSVDTGAWLALSCASAGNCAAGGEYLPRTGQEQAFVVTETRGTWGKAERIRGISSFGQINAISCPAPGDCTAGGQQHGAAFLATEKNGTWGKAFGVPGIAALGRGGSYVLAISCPSPGNCAAGGNPAFTAAERRGVWGKARPVAGSKGGVVNTMSCTSAGNCTGGGRAGLLGAYVVTETDGRWGRGQTVPGTSWPPGQAAVTRVSCPAPGQCAARGITMTRSAQLREFVATQTDGTWHDARLLPFVLDITDPVSLLGTLSCPAPGDCLTGGAIRVRRSGHSTIQAALAAQASGRWRPARLLRGVLALDHNGYSQIEVVSCPAEFRCTAVGEFLRHNTAHLFVTTER